MKAIQQARGHASSSRVEAALGALVRELFRRWPALVGFSVEEDGELFLSDVALCPWLEEQQQVRLPAEIAVALFEFLDCEPAARALLGGRTFARTLH
jgi:hypothetical protein